MKGGIFALVIKVNSIQNLAWQETDESLVEIWKPVENRQLSVHRFYCCCNLDCGEETFKFWMLHELNRQSSLIFPLIKAAMERCWW